MNVETFMDSCRVAGELTETDKRNIHSFFMGQSGRRYLRLLLQEIDGAKDALVRMDASTDEGVRALAGQQMKVRGTQRAIDSIVEIMEEHEQEELTNG